MSTPTTRAEHMAWAKERALAELEHGSAANALASICSDMTKHPGTNDPVLIAWAQQEGARALTTESKAVMRAFLEGFQ